MKGFTNPEAEPTEADSRGQKAFSYFSRNLWHFFPVDGKFLSVLSETFILLSKTPCPHPIVKLLPLP